MCELLTGYDKGCDTQGGVETWYLFAVKDSTGASNIDTYTTANGQVTVPANGTSMVFDLPLLGIKVIALPQLTGTNKMFAIPIALTYLGTDLMEDMSFDIKYDAYNDKLKSEATFRLGTNFIFEQYFVRLELATS